MTEETLFAAVLEQSPTDRSRFLEEACGTDAPLLQRLRILLAAHDKAVGILDQSARPPGALPATLRPGPGGVCTGERVGTLVAGRYKLLEQIGEGGMGVVYMAEQIESVRRLVALKIIKPGMDSSQVIARFEAERQALALMDHQNIARVLDAGTTDSGRPFFVMELVKGVPITRFCDDHQLTPRERLELFVPVCQAVQHAHTKGVIHRDLKPSNVLVALYDDQPVPKVIDFGVAKATGQKLTEKTMFTAFGSFVGTLEYMSPEQAKLNALDIDTRSDVYALGVLLYELLTGSTPLERGRLEQAALDELLRVIREEEPAKPSTRLSASGAALAGISARRRTEPAKLSRALRGELDWIVMKALEKDRTRRYETATGLARDIQHHLADEAVEACPPSAGYKLRKFARKNKKALVLAGAFALLLLTGTAICAWQAVRATYAEQEATQQRSVAADAEDQAKGERDKALAAGQQAKDAADAARTEAANAQAARDELRGTLYAAHMNLIQTAWEADNVARVQDLLEQHRPSPGETNERGFEWRYWQRQCHAELNTVPLPQPLGHRSALSPDGKHLASLYLGNDKPAEVRVWDVATGKEIQAFPFSRVSGPPFNAALGFSSDGTRLVAVWNHLLINERLHNQGGELKVWDLTGKELCTIGAEFVFPSSFTCVPLSPDGKRVACQTTERDADKKIIGYPLKVWDTATGEELLSVPLPTGFCSPLIFSPDGKWLAAAPTFAATGKPLDAGKPPDIAVQLWDASSGKEHSAVKGIGTTLFCLAFSPDGTRLATSSFNPGPGIGVASGAVRLWDVATGKQLLTFEGISGNVSRVVFSPDGKFLTWWAGPAFPFNPTIRVWDTATGRVRLTLKGHSSGVECVAYSPDGTRLHSAAADGTLKTWALPPADVKSDPAAPFTARVAGTAAASPDGTRYTMPSTTPGEESLVRVLDATTRKELLIFREHTGAVQNVQFSPDSKRIVSVAVLEDVDRTVEVKVWDAVTGKVALALKLLDFGVRQITPGPPKGGLLPSGSLMGVPQAAFSPDGARIALNQGTVMDEKGRRTSSLVKLWDVASKREVFATDTATGFPSAVQFGPDGKCLLASGGTPFKIKVLDAATYRELGTLEGEGGAPVDLQAPPTPGVGSTNLVFSRDGRRVANIYQGVQHTQDGRTARLICVNVWDVGTGRQLIAIQESGSVGGIALSPDGRRLATAINMRGASQGVVNVRDAATGTLQFTLQGQASRVAGVAFSPDGRRIASLGLPTGDLSRQPDVKVWDAATGHELLTLTVGSRLRVSELFFSPDGSRLVAAAGHPVLSDGDALVVWDATPLPEPAPPVEIIKQTIPGWGDVIDPSGDCTIRASDGKLTIAVPGTSHNLNKDDRSAPRVLHAVEGNFTLRVKVTGDFNPGKVSADGSVAFNGAGLILWIDHENYLRLERNVWFDAPTGNLVCFPPLFEYWRNGKLMATNPLGTEASFFKGRTTYLRLERCVGNLVASVSHDGTEWIALPPLRIDLPKTVRVGVDAVNTSKQPFVVEFEELRLMRK